MLYTSLTLPLTSRNLASTTAQSWVLTWNISSGDVYIGKLQNFGGTGFGTDGTMTQSAINTALAGKVSSFTATASVDAEVGIPSVTVTKSGTAANPTFAFAFNNIKGATGAAGSNNIVMVQSSQPTDSHCKIWIKP